MKLWEPIAFSQHSKLGLYNDDRFPGRSILVLRDTYTALEDVPMDTMISFMRDIQISMAAIKNATGAKRVNMSILGNRDPQVHAHLIPRFPENEEFPDSSPWNDMRPKGTLGRDEVEILKERIMNEILELDTRGLKAANVTAKSPTLFSVTE